jgi:FlaA1/EpsC-like NDP-sugar epimerase
MGDIRDYSHLHNVFSHFDFDYIYHAAALKHVVMCEKSPIEPVKTNILGTQNIIDLATEHGVVKTLFISTDKAVYPTNVMGATKFIAERLVLKAQEYAKKGQAFSCIRFGNVANSRGSVIPVFIQNMLHGLPLQVTNRNVTRFTMKIEDAVDLIVKATALMEGGEIFILKMKAFRLGDLVEAFRHVSKKLKNIQLAEKEIGLSPGEKLHEDLVNSLEVMNMYELDDMYVILTTGSSNPQYMRRARIASYSSNEVELLGVDELEALILECMSNKDLLRDLG